MTRQFIVLLSTLIIPNIFIPSVLGDDAPLPYMVTVGDSITAGLFANYSIDNPPSSETLSYLAFLALVGPSKSRTDRVHEAFKRTDMNWASGDNPYDFVDSHYERLREYIPDLGKIDFAHSGDTTNELESQFQKLFKEIKRRGVEPLYVIMLMGANDLCASEIKDVTTKKDFRKNVETALASLLVQTENTKVLVSSVPNIFALQTHKNEYVYGYILDPQAVVKCKDIWENLIPVCKTATMSSNRNRFKLMQKQLKGYNEILEETVYNLSIQFPERVRFSQAAYNQEILREDLSFDCFHPSEYGQSHLAEEIWRDGFWPFGF